MACSIGKILIHKYTHTTMSNNNDKNDKKELLQSKVNHFNLTYGFQFKNTAYIF